MAIRKLRYEGDPVLGKVCKEVKEMTPHLQELVQDMLETMYAAEGVGLAAPQVGVLRRIAVIDVGEGPYVFVNPKIVETAGEQVGDEGCLSVPGKSGIVRRPEYVKTVAFDEHREIRSKWKAVAFLQEQCVMNLIIWMVIYILKKWQALSMKRAMQRKTKIRRRNDEKPYLWEHLILQYLRCRR